MKKKVIGIAAGLILLAAAGGYAGVGHYYASHFFPKTAINGLNCAGLTAEQVKEEIQKHIVDYTLSITERGGKTEQFEPLRHAKTARPLLKIAEMWYTFKKIFAPL